MLWRCDKYASVGGVRTLGCDCAQRDRGLDVGGLQREVVKVVLLLASLASQQFDEDDSEHGQHRYDGDAQDDETDCEHLLNVNPQGRGHEGMDKSARMCSNWAETPDDRSPVVALGIARRAGTRFMPAQRRLRCATGAAGVYGQVYPFRRPHGQHLIAECASSACGNGYPEALDLLRGPPDALAHSGRATSLLAH